MIDRTLVWRMLGTSLGLSLLGAGLSLFHSSALAGGIMLGATLGGLPFASWAWIAAHGLSSTRGRVLTIALLAVKLALYSGALYLFVTRSLVNPVGVLAGITLVVATLSIGALAGGAPKAKEAA